MIHRNASILMDEVNQLLDFRKLDQKKLNFAPSFSNISEFVSEICNSFRELSLKNGINMNVTILEDNIETFFDRNKFKRILLNLLSNAVKYNNENGEISVVLDKIILKNGVNLRISISDTGIGINDSNKEKIFDRFYQENHDDITIPVLLQLKRDMNLPFSFSSR